MLSIALSLMALSVLVLIGGAAYILQRGSGVKQAVLMLVLAAILAANVAIWALPST